MPAPQALRFLAQLVRPGGSRARGEVIAALMARIADTLDRQQAVVHMGIAVDSVEGEQVEIREYAVRATRPNGEARFATYGSDLYAAVEAAEAMKGGEIVRREVVVGPWRPDAAFPRGPA